MRQALRAWLAAAGTVAAGAMMTVGYSGAANAAAARPALAGSQAAQAELAAAARPAAGSSYTPPAGHRVLYPGMRGADVRALQKRLNFLHYYAGPADGEFGLSTQEAVWAFKEVQSGSAEPRNPNIVGSTMQRQLENPKLPPVLVPKGGSHLRIEINKKIEVLVLYKQDKPELISHVSTGGGYYFCSPGGGCGYAITPDGNYSAHRFLPGWVTVPLGTMYNPVFFIGGAYAIHGDIPVPLEPVSHGCVRIPMDIANFFHTLINVHAVHGTPIYIRGPEV